MMHSMGAMPPMPALDQDAEPAEPFDLGDIPPPPMPPPTGGGLTAMPQGMPMMGMMAVTHRRRQDSWRAQPIPPANRHEVPKRRPGKRALIRYPDRQPAAAESGTAVAPRASNQAWPTATAVRARRSEERRVG